MKQIAFRDVSKCTKDCMCLFVCPYGATNTEDSIIDKTKCTGCGLCAMACPSRAIVMIPDPYPEQQPKQKDVLTATTKLLERKVKAKNIATCLANSSQNLGFKKLMKAFALSNKYMAEDLAREDGFMLPQSKNVKALLTKFRNSYQTNDFPKSEVDYLLNNLD